MIGQAKEITDALGGALGALGPPRLEVRVIGAMEPPVPPVPRTDTPEGRSVAEAEQGERGVMAERLASALVGELLALSDDDLRPLADRLAPFLAVAEPAGAFLSVNQAAERLGVHPNTVYRMIVGGRLRAVRAGRLWRIPEAELGRVESDRAGARPTACPAAVPADLAALRRPRPRSALR